MTFYMYVSNVFIRVSPQKNQYYTYVSKFFFASVSNQNLSSSSFFGSTFLSSFLPWIDQYPSLSFLKIDTIKRITFSLLLCIQYYQTPLLVVMLYVLCVCWKVKSGLKKNYLHRCCNYLILFYYEIFSNCVVCTLGSLALNTKKSSIVNNNNIKLSLLGALKLA